MQKLIAFPNQEKTGLSFGSDYEKQKLMDWLKRYKSFELSPITEETNQSRGYLEGAIVPAYCEWQYQISARERGRNDQRRFLFKRDFNYEIINDREGNPIRSPLSSKGLAISLADTYTRWAEENGAPIPNSKLYKFWRDKYAIDDRFPTFFDFIGFLGLECDAMPTPQDLEKLQ